MAQFTFEDEVSRKAPPGLPPEAVAYAKAFHAKQRRTRSPGDVTECIELAGVFAKVMSASMGSTTLLTDQQRIPPRPKDVDARRDAWLAAIAPRVQQIRRALFGSEQPPFGSDEDAAQWIEAENARQALSSEAQGIQRAIREKLMEWVRISGLGYRDPFGVRSLLYSNERWVHCVRITSHGPLARLEIETRQLAQATGVPPYEMVAHVLTGATPAMAPYSLSLSVPLGNVYEIWNPSSTITVTTTHLTDTQLREIRKAHRALWDTERQRAMEEHQEILWKIVRRRGEQPQEGTTHTAHWLEIMREGNATLGETRWGSWKAAKNAYTSLEQKLHVHVPVRQRATNVLRRVFCRANGPHA